MEPELGPDRQRRLISAKSFFSFHNLVSFFVTSVKKSVELKPEADMVSAS